MFEPFGPINAVRLRRDDKRVFKGSVFVEFQTEELLEKFAALEDKPKFGDNVLEYKTKVQYVQDKAEDIRAGRIQPSNRTKKQFNAHKKADREHAEGGEKKERRESNGGGRGGRGRGGGRGNGRGGNGRGRGGGRGGNRGTNANREQPSNGIPRLQGSTDAAPAAAAAPAPAATKADEGSNKRKAEESAGDNGAKKAKEATA